MYVRASVLLFIANEREVKCRFHEVTMLFILYKKKSHNISCILFEDRLLLLIWPSYTRWS